MVVAAGTGGVLVAGCGAWAMWPIRAAAAPPEALRLVAPPPMSPPAEMSPLDVAAFDVVLWPPNAGTDEPDVAAASAPPEPAAPGEGLALIGIITAGGVSRAVLYDERADVLLVVQPGNRAGRHSIGRVTDRAVEITDGHRIRRLSLDPSAGVSS